MFTEPATDSLLRTRQSLLSRLRDWQNQDDWREFFETYWRLIYKVARKSGLADADAQEVVQTTFIYLSRRMPNFRYDRQRGAFKSWLRVVTRSRLGAFRRREKADSPRVKEPLPSEDAEPQDPVGEIPDPGADVLDELWQKEWEENLLSAAMRRVRAKVSAQQLLIFRMATTDDLPATQVARKLDISLTQVYLARHRVGRLLKAEVQRLRRETE